MDENWYILFVQTARECQISDVLQEAGMDAFLPMMEHYRRDRKELEIKPMFPGYIFIRSELSQHEFDRKLELLKEPCQGLIKQLRGEETPAMREEEIDFFRHVLDETGTARMSYGYLTQTKSGKDKAVIYKGPLEYYEEQIIKVDRHNHLAWLDFEFMGRRIQAGLTIEKNHAPRATKSGANEGKTVLVDGYELDLEELKSRMNQL